MPNSKFLVHWTGNDLIKRKHAENHLEDWLVNEYANRLKNDYQEGLYTERKKEKEVLPGIAISNLVRICFSEIRLSESGTHAACYGELGIGFTRDFIAKKGGRRVVYVPYETEEGLLEQSIKVAWKKSKGNAELQKRLKWVLAFCKPMSNGMPEDSAEYRDYYEEMEWRLVYGESLDSSKAFTNPKRGIHRVRFEPGNVKLIIFPNDNVRQQTLNDNDMKQFFAIHQPDLILLENCNHF